MLWYKSFLETRWRFLIGLAILMLSVTGTVLAYPRVAQLLPLVPSMDTSGEIGRRIKDIADLSRTYHGYIWVQALRQNVTQMLTFFAVLLGTGGLLSQASGSGALFTLSLPVSRNRLLAVRTATGLAELAALAFVPILMLPLISPAVGGHFGFRHPQQRIEHKLAEIVIAPVLVEMRAGEPKAATAIRPFHRPG